MKQQISATQKIFTVTALALASLVSNVAGQGSLTPPGAPSPTMKTLDQIEPRTPLSGLYIPITISSAGSYYLTNNLTGVSGFGGISINASDVTLDLNGFSLIGVPGASVGIGVYGQRVTIRNGCIRNWGGYGVSGINPGVVDVVVKNLTVVSNGMCGIDAGVHSVVEGCVAEGNTQSGIAVGNGSCVRNCQSQRNGQSGIYCYSIGTYAPGATVTGCTVSENSSGIQPSANSYVYQNHLINNVYYGVNLQVHGARVENNHFAFNNYGIYTIGYSNLIIRNSFTGQTNSAISGMTAALPIGPLISASGVATNLNPNANFSY